MPVSLNAQCPDKTAPVFHQKINSMPGTTLHEFNKSSILVEQLQCSTPPGQEFQPAEQQQSNKFSTGVVVQRQCLFSGSAQMVVPAGQSNGKWGSGRSHQQMPSNVQHNITNNRDPESPQHTSYVTNRIESVNRRIITSPVAAWEMFGTISAQQRQYRPQHFQLHTWECERQRPMNVKSATSTVRPGDLN